MVKWISRNADTEKIAAFCMIKILYYPLDGSSVRIASGEPTDYHALAQLLSACYSDFVFDPEVLQAQDMMDHFVSLPGARWLAQQGTKAAAYGELRQFAEDISSPRRFLNIVVHPEYRGRGLGGRLYRLLMEHLLVLPDLSLRATVLSEDTYSAGFMQRRGFVCEQSLQEWALLLPYIDIQRTLCRKGICADTQMSLCSVEELQTDPERNRKLYRLIREIRQDTLWASDRPLISYDMFEASYLGDPSFFPEMAFVAVYAGEYIGYCDLRDDGAEGMLFNLTGVLRNYRRQGVAAALKRIGLERAQEKGYTRVRTFCSAENTAIQAINKQLGFVQTSAWTHLFKGDFRPPIK